MFHYQVLRDHVRSSWHWAVVRHWVIHRMGSYWDISGVLMSMDWFKGQIAGNPHIYWENLWFPIDFPLNQSIIDSREFSGMIHWLTINDPSNPQQPIQQPYV